MARSQDNGNEFLTALGRFEKCWETPIVPGEQPGWLQDAQESSREVGQLFRQEINDSHAQMMEQIESEDMELAPRVQELQEEDKGLLQEWESLDAELRQLCEAAERVEPHESKLDDRIDRLSKRALDFVIAVRKQDAAIKTWSMEAFNRDRGTAD